MSKSGLFIPCYNCSLQLTWVLESLRFQKKIKFEQILIIDNQSNYENTLALQTITKKFSDLPICIYQNKQNLGLGFSFKSAWIHFSNQGFTGMFMIHGDAQADLADFESVADLFSGEPDRLFVMGSRFHPNSIRVNYSKLRTLANKLLNWIFSLRVGMKIFDLGSGLNFYTLTAISPAQIASLEDEIEFDIALLMHLISQKMNLHFVPISWKSAGEITTINQWRVGWNLLIKTLFLPILLRDSKLPFLHNWTKID